MIDHNEIQKPDETMPIESLPQKKLDLGCGNNRAQGFIGVDVAETECVDVIHDLTQAPWPFDDESIDEARACHCFEHFTPPQRIVFMNELGRVLKKGAGCVFTTPRGLDRQMQDFTHQWPPIVETSYLYFDQEWLKLNKLDHYIPQYGIQCSFEVRPMSVSVHPEFALKSDEHKLFASRYYTNASYDMVVLMVKR